MKITVYDFHIKDKYDNLRAKEVELELDNRTKVFDSYQAPKTYKDIGGGTREHSPYEMGIVYVYRRKDKSLQYASYYDGCFHKISHKINKINVVEY
jgi:hypothetical protein